MDKMSNDIKYGLKGRRLRTGHGELHAVSGSFPISQQSSELTRTALEAESGQGTDTFIDR